ARVSQGLPRDRLDGRDRNGYATSRRAAAAESSAARAPLRRKLEKHLSPHLLGRKRAAAVTGPSTEHDVDRAQRRDRARRGGGDEIDAAVQCLIIDDDRGLRIERATYHRHILEECPVVTRRLEPQPPKLVGDVGCR